MANNLGKYRVTLTIDVTKEVEATSNTHAINIVKVIVRNALGATGLQVEFTENLWEKV
jgi:hypothetical protein